MRNIKLPRQKPSMSIHCRKRMSRMFWFSVLSNSIIRMGDNLATEMEEHYKTFIVSHLHY